MKTPLLPGVGVAALLISVCSGQTERVSYVSQLKPVAFEIPEEKWDALMTRQKFGWKKRADFVVTADGDINLKLLTQQMDRILVSEFGLSILDDYEFNLERHPKVLIGIRCVPHDYPGRSLFFGLMTQSYELTQVLIKVLDSDNDSVPVIILTRSAEHQGDKDESLLTLAQPGKAQKLANDIKASLSQALQNIDFSVQ